MLGVLGEDCKSGTGIFARATCPSPYTKEDPVIEAKMRRTPKQIRLKLNLAVLYLREF